ncbi:MAG TPA: glycosyltransferase family 4 protein [bacterium]|nr:glycosyltransferase family 4 protein [bacterium]
MRTAARDTETADIALVISSLGAGGAQRVLTNLANAWARQGRRICVITLESGERPFYALDPAVRHLETGGFGESRNLLQALLANLRRIRELRRAIWQSNAPLVVSFIGTTNILTILACQGMKRRVVVSERSDPARESLGKVWNLLRRITYRFADTVTANSHGALAMLARTVPRSKLAYVPNLLVLPDTAGKTIPLQNHILAVGSLRPDKGHDVLLYAFHTARTGHPGWKLALVGDGPWRAHLETLAQMLGIADDVIFYGQREDVFSFYSTARIFVLPSRREGMPNALLEAMYCGLPCVVSDASPGPLEYIEPERSGLVFPMEDHLALAEALRRLMADEALRLQLGQHAKERVEEFTPARALPIWETVLRLSGERNGSSHEPQSG